MSPIHHKEHACQHQRTAAIATVSAIACAAYAVASTSHLTTIRHPYHTSVLSRPAWVRELLLGNGHRIRENLGLRRRVFCRLVTALEQKSGLCDSHRGITTNEQVAIFLYMVTTGLTLRKVAERFQRSTSTVSQYVFIQVVIDASN